ncbi:hypothetical protein M408DRAFT_329399 [Serendipita vermifera MAFF 305830]|uniref:Uncharacterized protein n=1 Tax=Serendipita vermifera MAFF 305830 TaxID=933852 RepID=A0A0C3AVV0_SERVB|nr:hypothetical protein M408DRAFT_329399 [Serendipita vermifera MAFF 305830]
MTIEQLTTNNSNNPPREYNGIRPQATTQVVGREVIWFDQTPQRMYGSQDWVDDHSAHSSDLHRVL